MVEQKVVDYLLEGKRRGFSIQLLRQKLVEGGWDEDIVREAVDFVEAKSQISTIRMPAQTLAEQTNIGVQTFQVKEKASVPAKNGVLRKVGMSLGKPRELFSATKDENFLATLKYLIFVLVFPFVLAMAAAASIPEVFSKALEIIGLSVFSGSSYFVLSGLLALCFFVATPILVVTSTGILHIFVKLFRGQSNYSDSFKAEVYAATPQILFFFIPGIGIWSFVLMLFGLSSYHNISKLRAFFAILTLWILIAIILVLIFYRGF